MKLENLGFQGFYVFSEFINEAEEEMIVGELLAQEEKWVDSVSGRRKIDFGPQANFKKKKLKQGHFEGLPKCMEHVIKKILSNIGTLKDVKDDLSSE
jgi:DNA N6-methyl adenine demethylase